ncbi:hypothetical protein MMC13_002834 [Lambiella insularis]|nr:hypothetical protein [Lambiella insularis]
MTLQYHRKLRRDAAGLPSNGALGRDGAYTNNIEDPEEEQLYHNHVNRAFELWNGLSETQQREEYNTESLRAFAREQKEHGETHLKLARAEDEVANLRLQLQRLNTLEQPREFLLFAPDQLPVSSDAAALVAESSADTALDYDHLIAKWKTRIETSRNTQRELPLPETSISASGHHLNGLSSYDQHPSNGDPLDDDLIDAPGDEDDELGQQRMPTAAMDRGMLDPKLRGPGQDEVMQGIESDGDGYVGGRLLADLHEYGGINRRGL